MAVLSGFEYDIFISYRHNDNLDGWVMDFVQNLEKELRSTLKDTLTIYFDKNPHDGLLETHNVDKSLEGKLKCLIFIPIISQTYCDTKSFAWQHEFVAFNKLAKEDQFGRDIKLSNGNVASRILPIKIHDLDEEDKTLLENELGGALRAIEFIFKSAGVNRPLTLGDNPDKNLNKTFYKDQVNKVANAVKEIITALKNSTTTPTQSTDYRSPVTDHHLKPKRNKILIASLLFVLIATVGFFLYQQPGNKEQPTQLDKSIAVLPFTDMSPSHDQEYFGDGMAEEIINVLAQSEGLKVIARSSSFQFKGKNEDLRTIGKMLDVATILEGSIRKSADEIRVTAQLIKTSDGAHLWSKTFDRSPKDIFAVQDEIAKAVASALKTALTEGATTATKIEWKGEAQKEYQLGWDYFGRSDAGDYEIAYPHFKKSVMLDSSSAIVYPFLFITSSSLANEPNPKKYLDKALAMNPQLPEALIYHSFWYMFQYDFVRAQEEMNKALKYGPHNAIVLRTACRVMSVLGRHEEAIKLGEEAVSVDPLLTFSHINLSYAYGRAGRYDEAIKTLKRARELNRRTDDLLVVYYILNNQLNEAIEENEKLTGNQNEYQEILIEAKRKDFVKANQLLKAFTKKGGAGYYQWHCAQASAFVGNKDMAFEWLEQCFQDKEPWLTWIKYNPLFNSLHADPRFAAFLKKMNFPEE